MIKPASDYESPLRRFVDDLNQEFYKIHREIDYDNWKHDGFTMYRRLEVLERAFDFLEKRVDRLEEMYRNRDGFDAVESAQKESPALEIAGEGSSKEQ